MPNVFHYAEFEVESPPGSPLLAYSQTRIKVRVHMAVWDCRLWAGCLPSLTSYEVLYFMYFGLCLVF